MDAYAGYAGQVPLPKIGVSLADFFVAEVVDNHALSLAANLSATTGLPLVVLFVVTPGDYKAHDRSPRRIDFCLRNLRLLKASPRYDKIVMQISSADATLLVQKLLDEKNIPLIVDTYTGNRFRLPQHLLTEILPRLKATHVFGNIEYEVDELRRDTEVVKLGAAMEGAKRVKAVFVHDRLAVAPGILKSGKGTPYAVYSPWQRRKSHRSPPCALILTAYSQNGRHI